MALTDIEAVRLKTSDQPALQREEWEANGSQNALALTGKIILPAPLAPKVYKDNTLLTETTDYTVDYEHGIITFTTTPTEGQMIVVEYSSVVFSDEEVQYFIDEATSVTLAASNMLLAWAADAARIAKKESLSGGGGIGSVSITTDMRARELRESAKAYRDQYEKYENTGTPVEFVTEIAWTEQIIDRAVLNNLLDNS